MLSRVVLVAAVAAALMSAPTSAQSFASFSGTVTDSLGALLPAVRLVLTNTQSEARYEIRSTPTGAFEFVGLPPGQYVIDVALPGFRSFQEPVTIAGRNVSRVIALQVGELEETLHIVFAPGASSARATDPALAESARRAFRDALERCGGGAAGGGVAIGGSIRPPRQIRMVAPAYPPSAGSAGIGGTVRLQARIGADGYVRDVQNLNEQVHPDLVTAGIEAVRAWEYDGTLLNCVPVEVTMQVTLQFDVR